MGCDDSFVNGRPLSSPSSLMNSSPDSTLLLSYCCSCSSRSNSTNSLFQKRNNYSNRGVSRRKDEPLRGKRENMKKTWSVFKGRERSSNKINSGSNSSSPSVQRRFSASQSTSWTFVPRQSPEALEQENAGQYSPYEEEIKKRSKVRKFEKQQVFSMTPMVSRPSKPTVSVDNSKYFLDQSNLRPLLLGRNLSSPKHLAFKSPFSDVPRSPGPLDGSPYAQVKKKKRLTKDSALTSLSSNRGYHSADELSVVSKSSDNKQNPAGEDPGSEQEKLRIEIKKDNANPMTTTNFESVDLLRDLTNVPTVSVVDTSAESGYHTIMPEDDPASDRIETKSTLVTENPIDDSISLTNYDNVTITPQPSSAFNDVDHGCSIGDRKTESEENGERANVGCAKSNDAEISREILTSAPSSDVDEMLHRPKSQLTKAQVHEAVALINECLSEQESRCGPLSPDNTQLELSARLAAQEEEELLLQQSSITATDAAPSFSPVSPDYTLQEINRRFGEKSSEYALPVRDVVIGTIPARTARLLSQTSCSLPSENALNTALADLIDEGAPSPTNNVAQRQTDSDQLFTNGHKSSVDSGHSAEEHLPTHDAVRKATSCSDVDSGIDGSGLTASATSDPRFSPMQERNSVACAATTGAAKDTSYVTNGHKGLHHESQNSRTSGGQTTYSVRSDPNDPETSLNVPTSPDEEDEEERRVREEIESTQRRLEWLQSQRNKLKKQKEEKAAKRHSIGYQLPTPVMTSQDEAAPLPVVSATLPRTPVHGSKSRMLKQSDEFSNQDHKDVEELLRSVQNLDVSPTYKEKSTMMVENPTMMTAANPVSVHYPHYHDSSPGFNIPDPKVAKRADVFTPAYAHPMHQPQHMDPHHYQLQQQKQEEQNRKKKQEEKRLEYEQRQRQEREKQKRELALQEKRRQEERERQQRFQEEFEQKQKHQRDKVRSQTMRQPLNPPNTGSLDILSAHNNPRSPVVQSATLPSPRRTTAELKSDELQTQLDELDRYIAQLSSNFSAPADTASAPSNNHGVNMRRRRSFSIDIERKMDPNVPLSPNEPSPAVGKKVVPPRPPSRTRSSYDSVSRRLSHGFELAQMMRQNSIERDTQNSSKDDVFSPQAAPQPSYPPQTRHTRPPQQQIAAGSLLASSPPPQPAPKKMENLEEKMSPQLFLAMSMNPGGRPVEEIHSYKEDLDPDPSPRDAVDSAPPQTPGFPVSPTTPYVNNSSPSRGGFSYSSSATKQEPTLMNKTTVTSQSNFGNAFYRDDVPNLPHKQSALRSGHDRNMRLLDPNDVTSQEGQSPLQNGQQHATNGNIQLVAPTYADNNQNHSSSNGWSQQHTHIANSNTNHNSDKELKSPWVYSGGSSPHASTPGGKSPGIAFSYNSASGGVSPSASRSLTGSNDSLLSDSSSSNQPHLAYQQQRFNGSHPSLPPKESSTRNSGSSIRSTSTGSGYLGGTSQTSPHSAGSPVSSTTGHYPFSQPLNRRESQLSSYDRQGSHPHHTFSSEDGRLSNSTSGRTSSSSLSDIEKLNYEIQSNLAGGSTPKFIKDTTSYWYKPDITREQALAMLRDRVPGSFVVRDSRCYPGAFGLALKVHHVPAAVLATAKPGTDMNNELVRHFLIEPSTRGVKLKGCANEPVFGSLSALIYQHSITPIALPCKLIIPTENQEVPQQVGTSPTTTEVANTASELLRQGAACNVLYLGSEDTESLTGPEAIERAMRECTQNAGQAIKTSVVHFKVSPQGITLTDNGRKIFFRRHYPTATVTYCGMDPSAREPHNRRWDASGDRGPPNARVFGFVAKKPGSVDNVCHLFAELDLDQPAPAIVNFVSKVLIGSN